MLGLLIYQGLKVEEIMRVQVRHIQLQEAKLFIPETKRSNERWLSITAIQMNLLQEYLQKNKFKDGAIFIEPRKKEVSERNINNRLQYIFGQLKQLNSKVMSAKQIRNSVITEWLRKNNLRQVQYMAGHKYVSSTERYQVNNLEDLQNELLQHHPQK
jgi:site-specific recombinase XerD